MSLTPQQQALSDQFQALLNAVGYLDAAPMRGYDTRINTRLASLRAQYSTLQAQWLTLVGSAYADLPASGTFTPMGGFLVSGVLTGLYT